MDKYDLKKVNEAAASLKKFLEDNIGKHEETDPLLIQLLTRKYQYDSLEEAMLEFPYINNMYAAAYPQIITALKQMAANKYWPGMYVIHDLVCAGAHLRFCIRYAMKDGEKANGNTDG